MKENWCNAPKVLKAETLDRLQLILTPLGMSLADAWTATQPQMMRKMEADKTLERKMKQADQLANEIVAVARQNGMSHLSAREILDGDGWTSNAPATGLAAGDYVITPADKLGEGTDQQKYAGNIAAIKLVKRLQAEGKVPTQAGKAILVKYVGWGGLKGVFNPNNKTWGKQHRELKALLTPEEYATAKRSQNDAHYTSETVITRGVWAARPPLSPFPVPPMTPPAKSKFLSEK